MPKVEKSRSRPHAADNDVLEEAGPTAMAVSEQAADEPVKPSFAALSAHEQNGKRLEFRRARTNPSLRFFAARHVLQLKGQLLMLAELLVCWRNCQAFPLLNMLAHPYKSGKALSEPAVAHLGAAVGWRTCAQRNSWIREAGQTIQHSFGARADADTGAAAQDDAAQKKRAEAVRADHPEHEAGHAHESQVQEGAPQTPASDGGMLLAHCPLTGACFSLLSQA